MVLGIGAAKLAREASGESGLCFEGLSFHSLERILSADISLSPHPIYISEPATEHAHG